MKIPKFCILVSFANNVLTGDPMYSVSKVSCAPVISIITEK